MQPGENPLAFGEGATNTSSISAAALDPFLKGSSLRLESTLSKFQVQKIRKQFFLPFSRAVGYVIGFECYLSTMGCRSKSHANARGVHNISICLIVGIRSMDIIFACNFTFLATLQILCKVRDHHDWQNVQENWDVELLDLGGKKFSPEQIPWYHKVGVMF